MDVIQQLTQGLAEVLAKILFNKTVPKEVYDQIVAMDLDELDFLLGALVAAGRLEQAEDIFFAQYEAEPSEGLYSLGTEMYGRMGVFNDEQLEVFDFSRAEIERGLRDLEKMHRTGKVVVGDGTN